MCAPTLAPQVAPRRRSWLLWRALALVVAVVATGPHTVWAQPPVPPPDFAVPPQQVEETTAQTRPVRYVVVSQVSEPFRLRIDAALDTVPESVWRSMTRHGWRLQLASQVTDAAPQLRGQQPRGWPENMCWENTDAVHLPREKVVIVAEMREKANGDIVPSVRSEGLLRHELGHAFDAANGRGGYRSASSSFLEAYRMDLDAMPPEARQELAYYMQADEAGAQEAFAEAFGLLLGGGSDQENADLFIAHFANVLDVVDAEILEPEVLPPAPQAQPQQRLFQRFRERGR